MVPTPSRSSWKGSSRALLVVGVPPGQRGPPDPAVGRLGVEDHRLRHDQGAMAGGRGTPAEVDVVAEDGELVVEATELLEDAAAHQHAGGVHREDGADLVVLALVVLTALERRPLTQLGTQHVGVRVLLGRRQECRERVRLGVGVVVEDPHPLAVRTRGAELLEREPDGAGEGGGPGRPQDLSERGLEKVRAAVLAARVDRDDAVDRC